MKYQITLNVNTKTLHVLYEKFHLTDRLSQRIAGEIVCP